MRNRVKTVVAILLVVLFAFPSMAFGNEGVGECGITACRHIHTTRTSTPEYRNIQDDKHEVRNHIVVTCTYCGVTLYDDHTAFVEESHAWARNYDLGHSGTTHSFKRQCNCGYEKLYVYPCNGSPHVTPV